MLNRLPFWLGLLLGALAAFRLRLFKPRLPPSVSPDLRGFIADAFLLCDSAGAIVEANAAAQALFGPNTPPSLRYPTGQRVPPGQHPLRLAFSARETVSGRYRFTSADGSERVLEVSARPLPDGKAAAIFRDFTPHQDETQAQAAQARQAVVQALSRRLSQAQSAEAMGQAVAEEIRRLLSAVPDVQVRIFLFDPLTDTLTCLASAPDDRPKRPKSAAEAGPSVVRFDAQIPELWQMYVARESSSGGLPLIAGGIAIGHLSVTPESAVFDSSAIQETLEMIASLAALALAGPLALAQTAALTAQAAAVHEIAAALGNGTKHTTLADVVTCAVKRITNAEVCTLSLPAGGKLRVLGESHKDDLLFPQTAPNDPRLTSKATQKAWKTQKTATHLGVPNPSLEVGPWRAFAGSAGSHSVIALPLAGKSGVLSVYTSGDKPLPDAQVRFLETVAALVPLSPAVATGSGDGAS